MSETPVRDGECIEIATGAPLPEGADAVVMVEETDARAATAVRIYAEVKPRQNVGRRGADIRPGQSVLAAGDVINSSRIGALAAVGFSAVEVYRTAAAWPFFRPATKSSNPGNRWRRDRSTTSIASRSRRWWQTTAACLSPHPPAPDTIEALSATLDDCLVNDIVVFSGGSSVGERDLMIDVLSAKGRVLFHGISVKPGKPTGLAVVSGKPVFAMPGYPASCLTNAHILLVPLLRRIARLGPEAAAHGQAAARGARSVCGESPSVLYGENRGRHRPCRRSRRPATSPACRGRTGT